jgi:hypothetical protein
MDEERAMSDPAYMRTFQDLFEEVKHNLAPPPAGWLDPMPAIAAGIYGHVSEFTFTVLRADIDPVNHEAWDASDTVQNIYRWQHVPAATTIQLKVPGLLEFNDYRYPMFGGYGLNLVDDANEDAVAHRLTYMSRPVDVDGADIFVPVLAGDQLDTGLNQSLAVWAFDNDDQRTLHTARPDLVGFGPSSLPVQADFNEALSEIHMGYHLFGKASAAAGVDCMVYWCKYVWYLVGPGGPGFNTWEWRGDYTLDHATVGNRAGTTKLLEGGACFPIKLPEKLVAIEGKRLRLLREDRPPVLNFVNRPGENKRRTLAEWGL